MTEDNEEAAALAEVIDADDPLLMEVFLDIFPETQHRGFLESRMRQLEIERSAADEIARAKETTEALREAFGVNTLISEMLTPWADDPMQITARLGMEARVAERDPMHDKLDETLFVFFEAGSAALSDDAKEQVSLFARYTAEPHMLEAGPASLSIIGSCSLDESDMKTCQDRALAVRAELLQHEIYDVAIRLTENWGSVRQILPGDSGFEQADLNRYAAIMLLDAQ